MAASKINYSRQSRIFNPANQKTKIIVCGVGSVGSFVTLTLAKLGFTNIEAIDFDKIEAENIPNQFYRVQDIGKFKVDALQEIVEDYSGLKIKTNKTKIDGKFNFDLTMNTILVLSLDNMETRDLIFKMMVGMPVVLLDTRMGGSEYQIYAYDMMKKEDVEKCAGDMKQQISEVICGERSVIYTILSIASEACNIVKQIDKGEKYFKTIKRSMEGLVILGK